MKPSFSKTHSGSLDVDENDLLIDPEDTQGKPRSASRDIASMTTLPFGATVEDLSTFEESHLDVPLRALLKSMRSDIPEEELLADVWMWIDRRSVKKDIMDLDQGLATLFDEIAGVLAEVDDRCKTSARMQEDHASLEKKLDMAARAMLQRQYMRAKELFPNKDPEKTDFYKSHTDSIAKWKDLKLEPGVEGQRLFDKETSKIESRLKELVKDLIGESMLEPQVETKPVENAPADIIPSDLDPDLMKELGELIGDTQEAI